MMGGVSLAQTSLSLLLLLLLSGQDPRTKEEPVIDGLFLFVCRLVRAPVFWLGKQRQGWCGLPGLSIIARIISARWLGGKFMTSCGSFLLRSPASCPAPSCTMFLMAALLVEGGKFIILLSTCLSSRAPLVALDEFVGFKGSVIL